MSRPSRRAGRSPFAPSPERLSRRGRCAGQRGSFLLHAIILVTLLGLIGSMAIMLIMGRAMVVEKTVSAERGRFYAQAAESRANDCLQNVTQATCNAGTLAACGFPITVSGKSISASASWNIPTSSCRVTISVPD